VRLLLDTQVVLWQLEGDRTISAQAQEAIEHAEELLFSVISFAEVGVKAAIGKLIVPRNLRDYVVESGLTILGLAPDHGLAVADLPMHHRDPFDRLLISQAREDNLTIITSDRRFLDYDIPVILA
jgi:PIN domain nuclease of toxin-antitoxin system